MDMFVVRGGASLSGQVDVGGSKNASLPIMAAALSVGEKTTLHGVPQLVDVGTMQRLLESLGARVERGFDNTLTVETIDERPHVANYELVRRMRAGICVLGPLLAKRRRACVSLPGGCNIGHRPIDLHLKGLSALGAEIQIDRGYIIARARRLRGARVHLGSPFGSTVTGTCNVMVAAALAEGQTIIEGPACEPEVVDLGKFLNRAGARISGLGTPVLTIEGVERLTGVAHTVIPDRIEAATLMLAAAITRSRISLGNVAVEHLGAVIEKLRQTGTTVELDDDEALARATITLPPGMRSPCTITVDGSGCERPADCTALPYPGLPTDVQAQFTSLLALAKGTSTVSDHVFPQRFMHASELLRMGADIRREQNSVVITGTKELYGASVMASDLRASAALVLAALAAKGETVIRRIYHLDRGYERLETKLIALGAEVHRVADLPENVPASLRFDDGAGSARRAA